VSAAELRPATLEDIPGIVRLGNAVFGEPPRERAEERARYVQRRLARALRTDAGGAWVLEDALGLVGHALAVKREGVWALTSLAVAPGERGRGHGRRLMDAALTHGGDCHGFLVASSDDPRAWRTYLRAGFALVPTVGARGRVDRARIPVLADVREGGADDLERCAAVDRRVRGAGRVADLELLLEDPDARLYVVPGGYAMAEPERVLVLAADHEADAERLLWRALADAPADGETSVQWISRAQQWAVRTVLAAGLTPATGEPYFTRGRLGPLRPWLPNSALL
jgi:ribosomal protein S18 acetylase RimI-like enzyme